MPGLNPRFLMNFGNTSIRIPVSSPNVSIAPKPAISQGPRSILRGPMFAIVNSKNVGCGSCGKKVA